MDFDIALEVCAPPAKIGRYELEEHWECVESTSCESDDGDSIYSCQGYTTASAHDSWEDLSFSESSSNEEVVVDVYEMEYEIATDLSENEMTTNEFCRTSSDDESLSLVNFVLPDLVEGENSEASTSGETDDKSVEEVIIRSSPVVMPKRKDEWKCVRCNVKNEWPWRYCSKCYRLRKDWLPDRPKKPKKKRNQKVKSRKETQEEKQQDSGIGSQDSVVTGTSFDSFGGSFDMCGTQSSQKDSLAEDDICERCLRQPADGLFLHGRTAHQVYCYDCCKYVWRRQRSCPVCQRTTQKVVKVFQSFQ